MKGLKEYFWFWSVKSQTVFWEFVCWLEIRLIVCPQAGTCPPWWTLVPWERRGPTPPYSRSRMSNRYRRSVLEVWPKNLHKNLLQKPPTKTSYKEPPTRIILQKHPTKTSYKNFLYEPPIQNPPTEPSYKNPSTKPSYKNLLKNPPKKPPTEPSFKTLLENPSTEPSLGSGSSRIFGSDLSHIGCLTENNTMI